MSSLLVILIGTVLVNTFILVQHDATLSETRHHGRVASAIRIAGATSIAFLCASVVTSAVWWTLPSVPNDALLFVYALDVVAVVVGIDRLAQAQLPRVASAFASSPLLVVSNCLALGVIVLDTMADSAAKTFLYSAALGVAFTGALAVFVALALRTTEREIPKAFRFAPITFISAGLIALALMGFTGFLRG